MSEWQEEVVGELTELTEKVVKLRRFMVTEQYLELSEEQTELLRVQAFYMCEYADTLTKRLEAAE